MINPTKLLYALSSLVLSVFTLNLSAMESFSGLQTSTRLTSSQDFNQTTLSANMKRLDETTSTLTRSTSSIKKNIESLSFFVNDLKASAPKIKAQEFLNDATSELKNIEETAQCASRIGKAIEKDVNAVITVARDIECTQTLMDDTSKILPISHSAHAVDVGIATDIQSTQIDKMQEDISRLKTDFEGSQKTNLENQRLQEELKQIKKQLEILQNAQQQQESSWKEYVIGAGAGLAVAGVVFYTYKELTK